MPFSTNNTMYENSQILYHYMMIYFSLIYDILAQKTHDSLHLYKKSGIFYEPASPPAEETDEVFLSNVKMLSYNIDDMVYHRHQYPKKDEARAVDIITYLESTNADIICLQEVWGETMRQEITDAFLAKNYYVALPNWRKNYVFGENSGLMTISKYPIITQTFIPFDNSAFYCKLCNKGVQYCHIRVPKSNPESSVLLNIANTHLQASFAKHSSYLDCHEIAKKQLSKIISDCPYEWCLLIGDLNLQQDQLSEFIKNESKVNYFGENTDTTFPDCNDRLDYVLLVSKISGRKKVINIKNTTESSVDLSDHFPITTEFKFTHNETEPVSPRRASP